MFVRSTHRNATSERGQTLVLVAVMMFVLIGLAAMAVDVGEILWSRGSEQNAADAGALAGVRYLPADTTAAQQVAVQYVTKNGFGDQTLVDSGDAKLTASVTAQVSKTYNDNDTLTVTVSRAVGGGLRQAVGGGDINVPAKAVTIVAPAVPPCDIWPFGIEAGSILYGADGNIYTTDSGLPYGIKVVLKVPPQYQVASGDFLLLRPGVSSGEADVKSNIINGGCINNLDTIGTEPGNKGNPTINAVLTAITNTDPCYDSATQLPDSVYWQVNKDHPSNSGPYPKLIPGTTYTDFSSGDGVWKDGGGQTSTIYPYALGNPCNKVGGNGNAGPPTSSDPFPVVAVPSTSRVGVVPILAPGTFTNANNGGKSGGSFTAVIDSFAAFYLIGVETIGSDDFIVGAFLGKVVVKNPQADYGKPLNGPVDYFLWK